MRPELQESKEDAMNQSKTRRPQARPAQLDLVEAYLWIRQHMSDAQEAADAQAAEKR
jgi:hypothetical protein